METAEVVVNQQETENQVQDNQQDAQNSAPPEQNPFDAAAMLFGLYAPLLEGKLKELSTGELRRLVNGLVQYPLNEKEFINDSKNLREAFSMGHRLLEAKWVMFMQSMMTHGESAESAAEQENAEQNNEALSEVSNSEETTETVTETVKEESNG